MMHAPLWTVPVDHTPRCGKTVAIGDAIACAPQRSVPRIGRSPLYDSANFPTRAPSTEDPMQRRVGFRRCENDAWQFNEH